MGRFFQVAAFAGLALVSLSTEARAALDWQSTVAESRAGGGQNLVQVEFRFRNPERQPITVVNLLPSCGCMVATLEKRTYAQGEGGSVVVVMDTSGLVGLQEKNIRVFTDDSAKPTVLTMRVILPQWIDVAPGELVWRVGEAVDTREVRLTLNREAQARITAVTVDGRGVEVELKAVDVDQTYLLMVRPQSTTAAMEASVVVELTGPEAKRRTRRIGVRVK